MTEIDMFAWYCSECSEGHVIGSSKELEFESGMATCPSCKESSMYLVGKVQTDILIPYIAIDDKLANQFGLAEPPADIIEAAMVYIK